MSSSTSNAPSSAPPPPSPPAAQPNTPIPGSSPFYYPSSPPPSTHTLLITALTLTPQPLPLHASRLSLTLTLHGHLLRAPSGDLLISFHLRRHASPSSIVRGASSSITPTLSTTLRASRTPAFAIFQNGAETASPAPGPLEMSYALGVPRRAVRTGCYYEVEAEVRDQVGETLVKVEGLVWLGRDGRWGDGRGLMA